MMYQKYSKTGWENDVPKILKNGLRKWCTKNIQKCVEKMMYENKQNWVEKMMYQKYSKMGWENDIPKIFKNV